jgi:hypothetical protein
MEFALGIGIGKNGIYEFWEWINVEKIPRKWNSWILKVKVELEKRFESEIHEFWTWNWYVDDLTSKWYVIDLTSNYCLSM